MLYDILEVKYDWKSDRLIKLTSCDILFNILLLC